MQENLHLSIKGASENNLKSVSVSIPHNSIIAITGVSGSGKSSLAFDVIYAESRYRYLESLSGHNRQYFNKLNRPNVESIQGLRPAVMVDQKTVVSNSRSTVGTLSELYDYLRLLYARIGKSSIHALKLNRNLFSFNSPSGACSSCKGLGVVDFIDVDLLISDKTKTLREGTLGITTPTGYIIYSQVTMDVLNQVCQSEGFHVDIPWKDLTEHQKNIILNGSNKIKIPFGKHTLESRMKWKGITAKPREEGYYKGILPIMEDILKRDRNDNILRFARTTSCPDCNGSRLSNEALSVKWNGLSIAELSQLTISEIDKLFNKHIPSLLEKPVFDEVAHAILKRTQILLNLGLDYLSLSRSSESLSGGEAQRLRLANQAASSLQGVLYVLDEPTAGLHPADSMNLFKVLQTLKNNGNTIIVVEHDEALIRNADWIIDMGPKAGFEGGNVLFSGRIDDFIKSNIPESPTWQLLKNNESLIFNPIVGKSIKEIEVKQLSKNNISNLDIQIFSQSLNVITGVSGSGKSSLVDALVEKLTRESVDMQHLQKIITIDQKPIGKTSRSNPATYTKVFDLIRKLFGNLPEAKKQGFTNSDFSFNTGKGRCSVCEGAGFLPIGMHFMGNVEIPCDTCHGKRFIPEILAITYHEKSINDILNLRISESLDFFRSESPIAKTLQIMCDLGLGYLFLGQTSNTLSGGEAQRIKLCAELAMPSGKNCLYIFDEPTTGLHHADVALLLNSFRNLVDQGHTLICIEHHHEIIRNAFNCIDLGPGSGKNGGKIIFSGKPELLLKNSESKTAEFLFSKPEIDDKKHELVKNNDFIFKNITTHNLKNIDITIPNNSITLVTGVSGSGKSSLVFDTIFAECNQRFNENISAYIRSRLPSLPKGQFESCSGITPAIAITQAPLSDNPRSTVGTYSGVYDLLRLLFSRVAQFEYKHQDVYSTFFSFNHEDGACSNCKGLGEVITADPDKLITNPELSILHGAMDGTKTGKFYGDIQGQYIAIVLAVGKALNIDFSVPCENLSIEAQQILLQGTGDIRYKAEWLYKRGEREGNYQFEKEWEGIISLVNQEYERKHADKRGDSMLNVMKFISCPVCEGSRLKPEALHYKIHDLTIYQASSLRLHDMLVWLKTLTHEAKYKPFEQTIHVMLEKINTLNQLSLGHLSLHRSTENLSGGERQRLKLASVFASQFTGITIVLDEPVSGLHVDDRKAIKEKLLELKKLGNTIIVIEHQPDFFDIADHVIELGPDAGRNGGELLFKGTVSAYLQSKSKTALALNQIVIPRKQFENASPLISIIGANVHPFKDRDFMIPKNAIISISGTSGSGKSTLLHKVIYESLSQNKPMACKEFKLSEKLPVIYCNPSLFKQHVHSYVFNYIGIADSLRKIFAQIPEVKKAGIKESYFSLHQPGGRCEHCKGAGFIRISMDFLPDVEMPCPECNGNRLQTESNVYKWNGFSFADFLNFSINECLNVIQSGNNKDVDKIQTILQSFIKLGLGHLVCGQSVGQLSGGEFQRSQLALALSGKNLKPSLILIDEPARGLSVYDTLQIFEVFKELVNNGHTLVIADNNPRLVELSDYTIIFLEKTK